MKIKEIDPILQHVIRDVLYGTCDIESDAYSALSVVNWASRSTEEQMAYAKFRYLPGTSIETIDEPKRTGVVEKVLFHGLYIVARCDKFTCFLYDKDNNRWARVVSVPTTKQYILVPEILESVFTELWKGYFEELEATSPPETSTVIFKVGDRPEWTPDLIKLLPADAVLRCAMRSSDTFSYAGQILEEGEESIRYYETTPKKGIDRFMWFKCRGKYAEILSLPFKDFDSSVESACDKKEEFITGELVKVVLSKITHMIRPYAFFQDGKHWVYGDGKKESAHTYPDIQKIIPDPEKVLKEKAQEILSRHWEKNFSGSSGVTDVTAKNTITDAIMEALKTETK